VTTPTKPQSRNRLIPGFEEIKKLTPDYLPEDYALVQFLDKFLPPKWEIYFEPFFNGNYPDLVIFHPEVGMTIYAIKQWKPGEVISETRAQLKGEMIRSFYRVDVNPRKSIQDPVSQVELYRDNLIKLYCPWIGEEVTKQIKTLAAFKVGIYFPNMTTQQAKDLVQSKYENRCIIFGFDALQNNQLKIVAPDYLMTGSMAMKEDWADPIRFWLNPPIHQAKENQPDILNAEQKKIANPTPHKHMKVRGVIGSGKTLTVARRAAKLAAKGKTVLVVTFNITLWHYVKHCLEQCPEEFDWKYIEFEHFHGFCKKFLYENDEHWPTGNSASTEERLTKTVPHEVIKTVQERNINIERNYDAILIDEAQDFDQEWYRALCHFLSPNDEVLLVADEKQNVYQRSLDWLEVPDIPKLSTPWINLTISYRMPAQLLIKVNEFGKQYLPGVGLDAEAVHQLELPGFAPNWVWLEVKDFVDAQRRIWNCVDFLKTQQKVPLKDIAILVPSHEEGWQLVNMFMEKGINVNHVFDDPEHPGRNKRAFWITDPRLKITTIHSFKGWELDQILLLTPEVDNPTQTKQDSLIYTALSRTRRNLVVFNRMDRYREYGQSWPKMWISPTWTF